jgi:hypothetical protein
MRLERTLIYRAHDKITEEGIKSMSSMELLIASNAMEGVLSSHIRNVLVLFSLQLGFLYHALKSSRPEVRRVCSRAALVLVVSAAVYAFYTVSAYVQKIQELGMELPGDTRALPGNVLRWPYLVVLLAIVGTMCYVVPCFMNASGNVTN